MIFILILESNQSHGFRLARRTFRLHGLQENLSRPELFREERNPLLQEGLRREVRR